MQSIYNGFSFCSQAVSATWQYSREKVFLVDFAYVTTLRSVNELSFRLFNYQLIDPIRFKTAREQKWDKEVKDLRTLFKGRKGVTNFCYYTASCIDANVLKATGESLRGAPKQAESWFSYWISLPVRYFYRQFTKRGGREEILNSNAAKTMETNYNAQCTRLAHSLGGPTSRSLVNPELLLLKACDQVLNPSKKKYFPIKEIIFKRIAKSLSQQEELDKIRNSNITEGEKKIAVLDWLKKNNDLPKGLPDPDDGVFPENILEKENEALYKYICNLLEKFLSRHAPESVKKGVPWLIYELEGKDAFVHLAAKLIIQILIDQVADPNRFAQTILYSQGEILDLEIDGFGMNKEDDVFDAAKEVLEAVQKKKSISNVLKKYDLKPCPGGQEANRQKEATREKLREFFVKTIKEMFESEQNEKTNFEPCKPICGGGSIGWHFLMNMMNFGIKNLKYVGFFVAEKVEDYFARRMVDLIYHPSWKILLLQLIEELSDNFFEPPEEIVNVEKKEFDEVANFLGTHFMRSLEANQLPLPNIYYGQYVMWGLDKIGLLRTQKSLGEFLWAAFLRTKSKGLFDQFEKQLYTLNVPEKSPLEEGLEALTPSMRESLLYCRLTDAVRKKGYPFDGDTKFWEVFLRVALAQKEFVVNREEKITELLGLEEEELIEALLEIERKKVIALDDFNSL